MKDNEGTECFGLVHLEISEACALHPLLSQPTCGGSGESTNDRGNLQNDHAMAFSFDHFAGSLKGMDSDIVPRLLGCFLL